MELYYVCLLVVFFAFMATALNLKKLLELKIRQLELMIGKLTDKVAVLSLSKSKADEKIDELFRRLRSLTADVDGNVELVNKLVLDLETLEEYMEDRKALDQREERMLSGINNIMSYDASVAREAVKNLEESED
jgi:DNA repair exonuclease SbcCD ATPase subunit